MSKAIESFATYALLTDRKIMSGPEAIVNDSNTYQNYSFFDAWGLKQEVQGTAVVRDFIELTKTKRGQLVNAGHKWDLKGRDGMVDYQMGWGTFGNYTVYEEEEIDMNEADRRAQYKRLYKQKIMQMHVETCDFLEESMWANPTAAMETAPGPQDIRVPYSIPALITPGGLAPTAFGTQTKFGIDVSQYPNWRNHTERFNNFSDQIERLLGRARDYTNFKAPKGADASSFTGTPKDRMVMNADYASIEALRDILRNRNDRMTALGQYDGVVIYDGTPIVWVPLLGNASTAENQRRIFGINYDFLYPVCRDGWFMKLKLAPYGGAWAPHDMPFSRILYEYTCWNWWVKSMRRHFIICHENAVA